MLDLVSSVLSQEIDWEECFRHDLFCVVGGGAYNLNSVNQSGSTLIDYASVSSFTCYGREPMWINGMVFYVLLFNQAKVSMH